MVDFQAAAEADLRRRQAKYERRLLLDLFTMLGKMAAADGSVDAREVAAATAAFTRFPVAARHRRYCSGVFNRARESSRSALTAASSFAGSVTDLSVRRRVHELLREVANANGVPHPAQAELLRQLGEELLRISARTPNHVVAARPGSAHAVLGCAPTAPIEVVREAYRRLVKRHHPDVLSARGATPAEIAEATRMMERINAAWQEICGKR